MLLTLYIPAVCGHVFCQAAGEPTKKQPLVDYVIIAGLDPETGLEPEPDLEDESKHRVFSTRHILVHTLWSGVLLAALVSYLQEGSHSLANAETKRRPFVSCTCRI